MSTTRTIRTRVGIIVSAVLLFTTSGLAESARAKELFRAGKLAFADELYAVAEGHFRQLLLIDPNTSFAAEAMLLLGQAQYYQEQWTEATTTLDGARTKFPKKFPDAFLFWLAEVRARNGQTTAAIALYRELIETFRDSKYRSQAQFGLGDVLFRAGQWEEAKLSFLALLRETPMADMQADALIGLGKAHLALNDIATAEERFQVVITQHPKARSIWLAHYWRAECRHRLRDFAGALAELKLITDAQQKVRPGDLRAEAWQATGRVYLGENKFPEAASAFAQAKTMARKPETRVASALHEAEALVHAQQTDSAIQQLRAVEPSTAPIKFRIAELLYAQRKFDEALKEYRELAEKFPQSELVGEAHSGAGWALWELKRPSESVDEFALAAQMGPSDELKAQAQIKIGDIYLSQKNYTRAVESYAVVLTRFPHTSVAARAQFQIGFTQSEAGNFIEAATAWEDLVAKFGGSAFADRAQFQAGWARHNLRQFAEARRCFELVINNFPESAKGPEAWLAIANAWQAEGNSLEALARYESFPQRFKDHPLTPRARFERADCLAKMGGGLPRAREEMTKFLEDYPTHPLAAHAQFWLAQDLYGQKDQFLKAQEAFQLMAQKFPESELAPEALFLAGRAAMNRQAYAEAFKKFEEVIEKYPTSERSADARFFQAESLTEEGKFAEAILVYDAVIQQYPTCPLVDAAFGRKGDCHFTLAKDDPPRLDKAIEAYRQIVLRDKSPLPLRNEADYGIGRCLDAQGKPEDAFKQFSTIVYRTVGERECYWFAKAAFEATRIREGQKRWADAVVLLNRLAAANCPASADAAKRAAQIRKEHPEEF